MRGGVPWPSRVRATQSEREQVAEVTESQLRQKRSRRVHLMPFIQPRVSGVDPFDWAGGFSGGGYMTEVAVRRGTMNNGGLKS